MKKYILLIVATLFFWPACLSAQKHRTKAKKAKIVVPAENPLFTKMLNATAQIVIVDSQVVDSAQLLQAIHVNQEEGRLTTNAQFFRTTASKGMAYINELGTKCIFSQPNNKGHMRLFQTDKVGSTWTEPEEIKMTGEKEMLTDFDFPYLMPDGITLYFAARGDESLGGYDIYRTRLDAEEGRFLKPENMGLPFNSEANDFMYVIDEQRQLAYFATTRRQPKGKVCVYTFIPNDTRKVLVPEAYTPEKLRSMARIDRIADTWGNNIERKNALNRMNEARSTNALLAHNQNTFKFVVNDQMTYRQMADFKHAENQKRMKELLDTQTQLSNLKAALEKARNFYASASRSEREQLKKDILESEQQEYLLEKKIHHLEKTIRNTENR